MIFVKQLNLWRRGKNEFFINIKKIAIKTNFKAGYSGIKTIIKYRIRLTVEINYN